ncbi:MAG: hypothetical protein R3C01_11920 [Planctomycetaceae bacterium]
MNSPKSPPQVRSLSMGRYLDDLFDWILTGWDRFWFQPMDPIVLGVIRICTGLMLLYTHIVWGLRLEEFFGRTPILDQTAMLELRGAKWPSFWWYVDADWASVVHALSLFVLLLFTLGVRTRVTSWLSLAVAISYANRVYFATFGLDQINIMLTLYLAIGASGDALSWDQWRRTFRRTTSQKLTTADSTSRETTVQSVDYWIGPPSVFANIGVRLIQIHMCVIYFFAGVAKLQGAAWWNGDAIYLAFAIREYQTLDMSWIAAYPSISAVLTHASVAWEVAFCVLIWPLRLRPLMLLGSVLLHVGIGACLGMWTFGLIMIVGCSSFVVPDVYRQLLRFPAAEPVALKES